MEADGRTTFERLAERFPTEDHRKVNKGGIDQTYVPAEKVIDRLNRVLGLAGWSFVVLREGFTATEAWVLGEITATIDGVLVTRQQYGNESIVMGRSEKPTSDLLKKAATDSLKKSATLLGVAAYLYDEDERREVEQEMREAKRPKAPQPTAPTSGTAETPLRRWERLVGEAEAINLPTLGAVKAVDPRSVSANQLSGYASRLEASIAKFRQEQGAA